MASDTTTQQARNQRRYWVYAGYEYTSELAAENARARDDDGYRGGMVRHSIYCSDGTVLR